MLVGAIETMHSPFDNQNGYFLLESLEDTNTNWTLKTCKHSYCNGPALFKLPTIQYISLPVNN